MTTSEAIVRCLEPLPESAKLEVLDFVEHLKSREMREQAGDENAAWSQLSLTAAMRGMEDEESGYTLADLKETFR